MEPDRMAIIVNNLFPTTPVRKFSDLGLIITFSQEKLSSAVQSLCNKKATAPNGIPAKKLKLIVKENLRIILGT